jgi:hypothetical protein
MLTNILLPTATQPCHPRRALFQIYLRSGLTPRLLEKPIRKEEVESKMNVFASKTNVIALKMNVFASKMNVFALKMNVFASKMNVFASKMNVFALKMNVFTKVTHASILFHSSLPFPRQKNPQILTAVFRFHIPSMLHYKNLKHLPLDLKETIL